MRFLLPIMIIMSYPVLILLSGCSGSGNQDGFDDPFPSDDLLLNTRIANTDTDHVLLEGDFPLVVLVKPVLLNQVHDGRYQDSVEKLIINFGDGTELNATNVLFNIENYQEVQQEQLPVDQWASHTYNGPGMYDISAIVTWLDGTTTSTYSSTRVIVHAPEN